jgi:hypothetical protein
VELIIMLVAAVVESMPQVNLAQVLVALVVVAPMVAELLTLVVVAVLKVILQLAEQAVQV